MSIKNHPQYTVNDYKYLKAKGWTTAEIRKRWDAEYVNGKSPRSWGSPLAQEKLHSVLHPDF